MKIVSIVGARPQFIKSAVLSSAITESRLFTEIIVHTGQHFDFNMSGVFFEQLNIPRPKYNLDINSLSHGSMTGAMIREIEEILITEKPSLVIVYGDTNSTLAAALAASKLNLPIAHIEAGCRSYNMSMPEEINRVVCDRLSSYLYCSSNSCRENLLREIPSTLSPYPLIDVVGDIMYDAYMSFSSSRFQSISDLSLPSEPFVLCTIHRDFNTDDPSRLKQIIQALNKLSSSINILLPVHPRLLRTLQSLPLSPNINCIKPVSYLDMLKLLTACRLVITDSGGLQKEAFFAKRHCITIRPDTEWTELILLGVNTLLTGSPISLPELALNKLSSAYPTMSINPYGDGLAAVRILESLTKNL